MLLLSAVDASLEDARNAEETSTAEEKGAETKRSKQQPPQYRARAAGLTMQAGRPNIRYTLAHTHARAECEMGVAVCGPVGLTASTRRAVASVESVGPHGVYLHAESFGW